MKEQIVYQALRVFKKLTDQEAQGIIAIMKKGGKMTRNDIAKEFNDIKISTKTNAYEIIRSLHKKKMLSKINEDTFETIYPEILLKECEEGFAKLQEEIQNITITFNFKETAEKEEPIVIKQEHEVLHMIRKIHKEFKISFLSKKRKSKCPFWEEIKKGHEEDIIENKEIDAILFEYPTKEEIKGGVIILTEKIVLDGPNYFSGTLIFDPKLKETFKKHYGN